MRLEEVPDPVPGPGQVVVRIRAVEVNPGETHTRSGTDPRRPALPYPPGHDAAGIVEAVGEDVRGVDAGDRVYTSETVTGAYAGLALCHASRVHRLPGNVSYAQGAAVGVPYATAWRALFQRARAVPGETVLVHGASGGVGVAAVQIARAAGLRRHPGNALQREPGAGSQDPRDGRAGRRDRQPGDRGDRPPGCDGAGRIDRRDVPL